MDLKAVVHRGPFCSRFQAIPIRDPAWIRAKRSAPSFPGRHGVRPDPKLDLGPVCPLCTPGPLFQVLPLADSPLASWKGPPRAEALDPSQWPLFEQLGGHLGGNEAKTAWLPPLSRGGQVRGRAGADPLVPTSCGRAGARVLGQGGLRLRVGCLVGVGRNLPQKIPWPCSHTLPGDRVSC